MDMVNVTVDESKSFMGILKRNLPRPHCSQSGKFLIYKVFLHLGHIYDTALGQFLELGVVDVSPVHGNNFTAVIVRGLEHETVIGCGGREPDVRRHALVRMDIGVHFYAAFLLAGPGLRALASDNVLRLGIILMPRWVSLRASGNMESVISRNESNLLIIA
jgi:hypothetical protein